MAASFIRVLGSANWRQSAHNDHACYTVSDRVLIDACPSLVTQLQEYGVDPADIPVLCFTHMHADHILGLAPLLHYLRVCRKGDLSGLTIVGPAATVRDTVERAMRFVWNSEELPRTLIALPQIIEWQGACSASFCGFAVQAMDSDHAVPGLCYRFTDEQGHSAGFTGDTAYQAAYGEFFRHVDILVHEAGAGVGPVPEPNPSRHCGAFEASRVCREAQAKHLLMTHAYAPKREAILTEARRLSSVPVDWATPGETFAF